VDFSRIVPRSNVPLAKCHEMPAAMRANLAESERLLPIAEDKLLLANDAVRDWTEQLGKIELAKRKEQVDYWRNQIWRHQSDRRHWLMQAQAWRDCLTIHGELAIAEAGTKCSHGYPSPMCAMEKSVLKVREREPGDDDEEAA